MVRVVGFSHTSLTKTTFFPNFFPQFFLFYQSFKFQIEILSVKKDNFDSQNLTCVPTYHNCYLNLVVVSSGVARGGQKGHLPPNFFFRTFIYIYIYIYVCMYVYIYIHICYIYIHIYYIYFVFVFVFLLNHIL